MNGLTVYALNTASDTYYAPFSGEAWAKAAEVTLVGMALIFTVLIILWGVLALFKVIFASDKKAKKAEKKADKAPVEPETKAVEVNTATAAADGSAELIAVITAAVAAYRASEEGLDSAKASGFKVVSFKRANAGRAWNSNKK